MSHTAPQNSSLRRLLCWKGRWLLEVETMVPIDPNVLRPMLRLVEEGDSILETLAGCHQDPGLLASAQQLMGDERVPPRDLAFVPNGGHWVPVPFVEPSAAAEVRASPAQRPGDNTDNGAHQGPTPAHLDRTLDRLAHTVEALRKRVRHAEEQMALKSSEAMQAREMESRCRALEQRIAALEQLLAQQPRALERLRPQAPHAPEQSEAASTSEPAATPPERSAAVPQPAEPPAPLRFPTPQAIDEVLQQLVGDGVGLVEAPPKTRFSAATTGWYAAAIVDDRERVRGAVLVDLKATVQLGGSLIMLPRQEIVAQQRSRQASDDVVAAMSEVLNTVNATINLVAGNPHVRSTYLEPLEFSRFSWIAEPDERLDLAERSGGTLVFLAQDPARLSS